MTAEGNICWPPACNPSDMKVPPNNFGPNLTKFTNRNRNQFNGNQKSPIKKTATTRTLTEIITRMGREITIIKKTRRSLETEIATRMPGKLNLLRRMNLTSTLDKLQSARRK